MDYTIFAQSIARIRHMELSLIDKTKFDSLIEAKDFAECMRILQDTKYGEYVEGTSYEAGLKNAIENLYAEVKGMVPVKEVVEFIQARYDGHNIKSLIKGKILGIDTDNMLINAGTLSIDSLKLMIKEENFSDMPVALREGVEKALSDYNKNQDPQMLDVIIDRGTYNHMLFIAKKSGMDYIVNTVKLMIDMINVKAFIRIKLQERGRDFMEKIFLEGGHLDKDLFLNNMNDPLESFASRISHTDHFKWVKGGIEEYIKAGDVGSIEKYGDNFIIAYIKDAKYVSFGPQPIIAFIIASENEIKMLRIILASKRNDVSPEAIRERLRDVYV